MRTSTLFLACLLMLSPPMTQAASIKPTEATEQNQGSLDAQTLARASTLAEDRQILERQAD